MKGRYYLGRIVKINLNQEQLMETILDAPIVTVGKFDWTITDIVDGRSWDIPYIFGKLSKYSKEGPTKVIDELKRSQVETEVPNLLLASSSFVYLPDYSGIAFLYVSNGIQDDLFPRRFKSVVEKAFDGILVSCEVEPITDYRAFTTKLKKLNIFTEFDAVVHPPNPLFGRLWGSLNNYIESRNASEVAIKEKASKGEGLDSNIINLMDNIMDNPDYEPEKETAIGDAAILMAADGYGRGKVVGIEAGEKVTIKTSETQKSFLFEKEPTSDELALEAKSYFEKVSTERDMRH